MNVAIKALAPVAAFGVFAVFAVTPRLRVVDGVAVPWCDPPKDKTP